MNQHLELVTKRTIADYATMIAVIPFIASLYMIVMGKPELALLTAIIAFIIDSLDGVLARKLKQESIFGRQLDSAMDSFIYLVFPGLFVLCYLNPNFYLSFTAVSVMIVFGLLRLIRFNQVGYVYKGNDQCYPGLGVAYILLAISVLYILQALVNNFVIWLTPFILIIMSFAMISNIPIRKPWLPFWYLITLIIGVLLLYLHFSWL